VDLIRVGHPDVTPAEFPLAAILTVIAIVLLFFPRTPRTGESPFKREQRKAYFWAFITMAAVAPLSLAPYLGISGHRFVHYLATVEVFVASLVVLKAYGLQRPRKLAIVLFALGGAVSAQQYVRGWNWIDFNANWSRNFTNNLVASHPDLRSCSSVQPCCVRMSSRNWGHNEWVLSWNLGNSSKSPAYFPEGWPGVTCQRVVKVD
jgi:hypothetical protein